jgi:ribosomal protein S18 acetylase RimI-like enzyme
MASLNSHGHTVRRAGPDDARAIAETGVIGWRSAYRGLLSDEYLDGMSVDSRDVAWRQRLESDPDGLAPAWVGEAGGRVVAFVSGGPPRDDDIAPPAAEIYAIYLRPEAWRQGLGTALMDTATAHFRANGATYLVLWVFETNARARSFYEALGWVPDGGRQVLLVGGVRATEVRYRLAEPLGPAVRHPARRSILRQGAGTTPSTG